MRVAIAWRRAPHVRRDRAHAGDGEADGRAAGAVGRLEAEAVADLERRRDVDDQLAADASPMNPTTVPSVMPRLSGCVRVM